MLSVLLILVACCAVLPAALFAGNVVVFRKPPLGDTHAAAEADVSVIIPARNEARNIEWVVRSVLSNGAAVREVIVVDDGSTDGTAAIVESVGTWDARVTLLRSAALPPGWNGKQHACWQGANAASGTRLLFLDADVRLEPTCLPRMAAFQRASGAALVSGFPKLVCVQALEKLLLPKIHFVLLSYLPFAMMRRMPTAPALAAGCGQFLLCTREAYFASGGHAATTPVMLRSTMHDGLKLPKLFREKGFATDLADITDLASVRMYRTNKEVWYGLGKNATEGMASPGRIVPFTLLLLLGQVVPSVLVVAALFLLAFLRTMGGDVHVNSRAGFAVALILAVVTLLASFVPAFVIARRYRQPMPAAWFHPQAVLLLVGLQWWAFIRERMGHPVGWRGRRYPAVPKPSAQA